MSCPLRFPDDLLSDAERAALIALAERLWNVREVLAAGWATAVGTEWLASAPPGAALSPDRIANTAQAFVVAGLEQMRRGDFEGLSEACYETARALVSLEALKRVSLADLYTAARLGLRALDSFAEAENEGRALAHGKLTAHLLVVLGLAYSDAREEALARARGQLERIVDERTAALAKEKEVADTIIESLPSIFYLFDEEGRFLRWNRNFEAVSAYSSEEIARMHPVEFFDGEGRAIIAERIGEVLRTGQSTAAADFVSKNGTRTPYFFTGRRVLVEGRTCVIGMGIDVTERKRAEEALQRARTAQLFASLLESAPDAMVVCDRTGAIVFANSQTERLFGYPRDELLGQPLALLIPDGSGAPIPAATPLTATVEADGRRREGSSVPIEIKLSPLETEDGLLLTSAIRDITDRRRAEEEIRRLNVDLEHRVAERTRELARSNADLEQFAYVASHDLQEPLRAVASYSQLLARRYQHRLDGDALRFIERTSAAVSRMQALIRDLLAYSRVGTRGAAFGPADCERVLREVLDDLQAAVAETGAVVTHDPLPTLAADESQIRQLLQNLIGNAIKFRGAEPPRVHVAARRDGDGWRFTVRDNGIGIGPEFAERVFVIFQRLHGRRAYPGTGVGLAICKRIVERHGGRIWIEPGAGGGTTLCFQIPTDRVEDDDVGLGAQ